MVKQIIVVNKELNMSKGKMAAQVSHASMAFLTYPFLNPNCRYKHPVINQDTNMRDGYVLTIPINDEVDEWISNSFTKVILSAKNENQLYKIIEKAKENGLEENKDFFCIRDNCKTELTPDETGTRFTCIGFVPMESEKIDKVTKKLQLLKE